MTLDQLVHGKDRELFFPTIAAVGAALFPPLGLIGAGLGAYTLYKRAQERKPGKELGYVIGPAVEKYHKNLRKRLEEEDIDEDKAKKYADYFIPRDYALRYFD